MVYHTFSSHSHVARKIECKRKMRNLFMNSTMHVKYKSEGSANIFPAGSLNVSTELL